ncbi:hypothetical protein EBR66_07610 [bacterium]|nr:hypothetical protein [bacterium]
MAVFIDEPTPIARSTASQLLGIVTPAGVLASTGVGVVSQQYLSAIYGNGQNKAGQVLYLNQSSIMDVLNYSGRFCPAFSYISYDSSATTGVAPSSAFGIRGGFKLTVSRTGYPTFNANLGLNTLSINPVTVGNANPYGPYGVMGVAFQFIGAEILNLTRADLIAGQLPEFRLQFEMYMAWNSTPPPSGVFQFQLTPVYQDNSIILPAPYFPVLFYPRSKPATSRGFSYDNLTALQNPYNIIPNPYVGVGVDPGNVPDEKAKLMALYRQFKSVANGGPSYQYAGVDFPPSAKIFDCDLKIKVFPPLYYVYGIDIANSTINWYQPSYSANPLDSRP